MESNCKHNWKFLKTSWFIFSNKKYKVDRYECRICEKVYSIDTSTGKRINLYGKVGEEAE